MEFIIRECTISESGNHEYDLDKITRDDMAFYLDCRCCHKTLVMEVDTIADVYELFGLGDYDDE